MRNANLLGVNSKDLSESFCLIVTKFNGTQGTRSVTQRNGMQGMRARVTHCNGTQGMRAGWFVGMAH